LRRQRGDLALRLRRPRIHLDPVREIAERHPHRRLRLRAERRNHRIQKGQGHGRSYATQKRPPRKLLFQNHVHGLTPSPLRIRKGLLLTISDTSAENLYSRAATCFAIRSTTGPSPRSRPRPSANVSSFSVTLCVNASDFAFRICFKSSAPWNDAPSGSVPEL